MSLSKKGKDFGQGFYLNPNYNQALEMAEFKVDIFGEGSPLVTSFDFDGDAALEGGLSIKVFDDYSEEWAQFVVESSPSEHRGEYPAGSTSRKASLPARENRKGLYNEKASPETREKPQRSL
ncbi:MAG: DUF3990 domain-containing protein [Muribaculum sp.]|nr:DUF3990 domain-containing protein [Muribaculum sp.]